jgi:hypothetical protein
MELITMPAWQIGDKSRCCGKKPIVYKRDGYLFCCRCGRSYDLESGRQISNFSYVVRDDGTVTPRKYGSWEDMRRHRPGPGQLVEPVKAGQPGQISTTYTGAVTAAVSFT